MASIRLNVPETAARGDIIEIKTLIQHPMETGYRRGARGEVIERDIIKTFECIYDGETVFEAEFFQGIAANPFLTFHTKATKTGTLEFRWTDEHGVVWTDTAHLTVT